MMVVAFTSMSGPAGVVLVVAVAAPVWTLSSWASTDAASPVWPMPPVLLPSESVTMAVDGADESATVWTEN